MPFFMNTSKKPRKHARIDLVNEVFFQVGKQEVRACWSDISEGGIFVQTMNPLPVGSQVRLKIRLEADPSLYLAVGLVRHSLSSVGMGIEFTHVHPKAKRLIAALAR
jgi:c-di-GMP-binding flagellar brake protein YcgR